MVERKIILKQLVGSRLHDIHSEESDYDYRQVVVSPLREVLWADKKFKHNTKEDTDVTTYEFAHFIRLLHGGNITALETFFGNQPVHDELTKWVDPYKIIDPEKMVMAAKGFGASQLKQLDKHSEPSRKGKAIAAGLIGFWIMRDILELRGWVPLHFHQKNLVQDLRRGIDLEYGQALLAEWSRHDFHLRINEGRHRVDLDYIKNVIQWGYTSFDMFTGHE